MTKKLTSRLLSILVSLCMVLALFPTTAFAAEGDVAQIGGQTYATLDEAVEAAEEGATIVLLQDCELTKGFNKTLTFTGNGKISINKQLTSNGEGWMCFGLYDPSRVLTFDGAGVEVEWNSEVGTAPWLMISLSGTMNVTNGAKVTFNVDSGATGSRNAIYMNAGSSINVTNGSSFTINGYATTGKEGQGIQLDQSGKAQINVTGNSTFEINGTNRGYVNSPTIYVEDSTFTVKNCTANASNGGNFTAVRSQINYVDNAGHGLSAGDVTIKDSDFTAENNGYYGVYVSGAFLVDSTSTLTVTGNSAAGDCAGLKLTSGVTDGKVEAGAVVNITDNYCSGLSNNGKVVFEEGSKLTITGNNNDKGSSSNGGGIYNSGASANLTLPSDSVIYNNHAKTAGDDIFSNTNSTITFGQVGTDWVLDDCNHLIDGWYDDSADTRWEAHADIEADIHVEKFAGEFGTDTGLTTVTGLTQLKAAHGLDEKTSLPGLDKDILVTGEDGSETGVDTDTVTDGSTVKFQLKSNVPQNLKDYINYPETEGPEISSYSLGTANTYTLVFHDKMAAGLTLNSDSFQVMLGDEKITDNEYVTITTTGLTDDCTFEVSVNLAAMYNNDVITEQDLGVTPITVTYTATLPEGTVAGAYTNTAWVVYPDGESEESTVTVYTYGIDVFKYDQSTAVTDEETHEWSATGLPGAQFALYDESGVTVAEDGTVTVNEDAVAVWTGTSGADGHATIPGLDEGTYYLVETKAPDNYVMNTTPLEIEIPADADEATYMVHVNFANSPIPHTGGTGTMMYTIGGAAIVVIAGILLVVSRKSRKKQDR